MRTVRNLRLLSVLLCLGFCASQGACFSEPTPECSYSCGDNGLCRNGYYCASDGWCKRDGVPQDFVCSPFPLIDASNESEDAGTTDAAAKLTEEGSDQFSVDLAPETPTTDSANTAEQ